MNRTLAAFLENFFSASGWPLWLAVAGIVLTGLVVVFVFRAEKSLMIGIIGAAMLAVIGVSAVVMLRGSGSPARAPATAAAPLTSAAADLRHTLQMSQPMASLPALSCLDGLAGESVESACEKAVFASAESVAAAVSYSASQITRLASLGNVAAANKVMTPELRALRRAVERDRFGMIAQVLTTREECTLSACPFFASLTNTARIATNMNDRLYDAFVTNYSPLWNAPVALAPAVVAAPVAMAPSAPTGKPMSGDFPTASSIPPVNIMTPEPAAQGSAQAVSTAARGPDSAASAARAQSPPSAASKKTTAQKSRAQAPTSLAPAQASDDN